MRKRAVAVFFLFCICIGALCLRIFTLSTEIDAAQYTESHNKKITLDYLRLPLLDCNGERITCRESETYIAAKPVYDVLPTLRELLPKDDFSAAAQSIAHGTPVYAKVPNGVNISDGNIITLRKYVRYSENAGLTHLTGYVNSDGNGVGGIESAFNSLLKTDIPLYAGFACGGDGQVIGGAKIETNGLYYSKKCGLKLTIDSEIQRTVENALANSDIKKGAALVCETKTGAVRAMASVPTYERNDVSKSLEDDDSPLVNRAISAYPVGSVFKAAVAASALDCGVSPSFSIKCTGSCVVDGKVFHCNNGTAHGVVDMQKALTCSCNCYFIRLAQKTGCKPLIETAGILGYGHPFEIAEGLFSSSGNLPTAEKLSSTGQLALFSFGQGTLTATTLQIANTFSAIGNGGYYTEPYTVTEITDVNGERIYSFTPKAHIRAFSEQTADTVKNMLKEVVRDGTAKKAYTELFESAGKTATAQTGVFTPDKNERLCTWFGGFFPADDPEYTVVIIKEDGTTGGEDCAPVYKEIAERVFYSKQIDEKSGGD